MPPTFYLKIFDFLNSAKKVINMDKQKIYNQELAKLKEIFQNVEKEKAELCEGLILDAAFMKAENTMLKYYMKETGMIKVHKEYPEIQKPTETAKQYLKNVNSYANVIKTLNSVLNKSVIEQEDAFDLFLKKWQDKDDRYQE